MVFFLTIKVNVVLGDYSKAKNILGWEPKIKFDQLVEMIAKSDYDNEVK